VAGSRTDRADAVSTFASDLQRNANPSAALGVIAWQSPAKLRDSKGALARDLVLCAMGDLGGSWLGSLGSMPTLGGATTFGGERSSKVILRGVAWKFGGGGGVIWRLLVKKFVGFAGRVRCGVTGRGAISLGTGVATLGSSGGVSTLGRPGVGIRLRASDGGARRRHESKRSRRLAMASTCEMDVGGGASLRAPDMTCRLWMILSSGVGDGMVR